MLRDSGLIPPTAVRRFPAEAGPTVGVLSGTGFSREGVMRLRKSKGILKRSHHSDAGRQLPTICTIPSSPSTLNCPCDPAALADNVTPLGSRTGL
jgi:hypothetical protein